MSTAPAAGPDTGPDAGPDPGRRARYEALFGAVYEPLQRYVRRRCPAESADDVVAKVLLVLWQRLDDVPAEAPIAWTYGVARRCLANERRGSRRRLALVSRLETSYAPSDPVASDDPDLDLALGRLSPDDRELVRLWAWERLAPSEIAAVLDITANAASIRLHRAKARLADHLGPRKISLRCRTHRGRTHRGGPVTDHELEQRLQRIDPVPAATSVDTPDSPQARAIMEQIMQTQAAPVEEPTSSRRRWVAAAAVVGAAAAIAIGVAVVRNDSTSSEPVAATYDLQASDPMAMCLALSRGTAAAERGRLVRWHGDRGDGRPRGRRRRPHLRR